jgi:hypothetical protein
VALLKHLRDVHGLDNHYIEEINVTTEVFAVSSGTWRLSNVFVPNLTGAGRKLVPGTTVALKAMANGRHVCAENAGADPLIANRASVGGSWERFDVVDAGNGFIALRSRANSRYVCAENGGASALIANRTSISSWERFQEMDMADGTIALRARANRRIVCADNGEACPPAPFVKRGLKSIAGLFTLGPSREYACFFRRSSGQSTPRGAFLAPYAAALQCRHLRGIGRSNLPQAHPRAVQSVRGWGPAHGV